MPTVKDGRPAQALNARGRALQTRIAELGPESGEGRLDAISLGIADALLEGDETTLVAALDGLRAIRAGTRDERLLGWLTAAIALSHWGIERLGPDAVEGLGEGTQARDFLDALRDVPQLGSADLRRLLETDETQVSRTGRRLLESGLVIRRKSGRQVFWQLSPRGRRAVAPAPAGADATSTEQEPRNEPRSFWMEAIRRGFRGAAGDEPAPELREVDPPLESIVECTLDLHSVQGIQATTWPQIAQEAGVSLETVQSYFPTLDDLIRGCGTHFLASLRLPPPERANEVFAGASSAGERIRRLVGTVFDVYERRGDSLESARRERADLPLVDDALDQVDVSLDALVARALELPGPDAVPVPEVRALTDVTVWRALREQGASPEAIVEEASLTVERWLATHPAG